MTRFFSLFLFPFPDAEEELLASVRGRSARRGVPAGRPRS